MGLQVADPEFTSKSKSSFQYREIVEKDTVIEAEASGSHWIWRGTKMAAMTKPHGYSNFVEENSEKRELKRAVLIVNPNSGGKRGLKILAEVKPLLEKGGVSVKVLYTKYAGHARDLAREEDLSEVDVFCPVGGDGTVHETVNGFMTRTDYEEVKDRVSIGIIPGGTGNTLAYDLHINTPAKAAKLIIEGVTRQIDVGKVESLGESTELAASPTADSEATKESAAKSGSNVVYSINIVGYGLPSTVMQVANSLRWLGGAQYKLAAYQSLLRNRGYKCDLEFVDKDDNVVKISGKYAMIQAQVTIHMGERMAFAPNAKLDDGLLDLIIIEHGRVGKMLATMTAAQKNKHLGRKNVKEYQVKSLKLTPKKGSRLVGPKSVNVDGELAAGAPFQLSVVNKGLRVVSP